METRTVHYELTRFIFQRSLAFIYVCAFAILVQQFIGLCGAKGLLPVRLFVKRVSFSDSPSLFFFWHSDAFMATMAWLGLGISLAALSGIVDLFSTWISALTWFVLWLIYLSFVNVGQTFYGFGWEILLLETGFLAIFLGPLKAPAPVIVIFLIRWLLFRIMFGAGLIKIRGDSCWRDLTCLFYHYETQPMPNPLSWYFHHLPDWFQKFSVLFNHFVELIMPFAIFGPRPFRLSAGVLMILFQLLLIVSGNFSWFNCLTIVLCLSCLDDGVFSFVAGLTRYAESVLPAVAAPTGVPSPVIYLLALMVVVLSARPVLNLVSNTQVMNTSFDPLHLVNTYGAFGSITRERYELAIEGTHDTSISEKTQWLEYEFKGKPGDPKRIPPQVTPYHYKLDWQMWFAAMSPYYQNPWIVSLLGKLLTNEPDVVDLLRTNPFADRPPEFVRVRSYIYRFTDWGEEGWWKRELRGEYLPPLSLKDEEFRKILIDNGWFTPAGATQETE